MPGRLGRQVADSLDGAGCPRTGQAGRRGVTGGHPVAGSPHAGADRDGFHQAPGVGGAEAVAVLAEVDGQAGRVAGGDLIIRGSPPVKRTVLPVSSLSQSRTTAISGSVSSAA